MKRSKSGVRRVKVSADGTSVVSHAGLEMMRELAVDTGLVSALNDSVVDTYRGAWIHVPAGCCVIWRSQSLMGRRR